MESVSSEQAAVALAPHRHASHRRAVRDGASHADSTTASSQHNHTQQHHHHQHHDGSNAYDGESNGGVHKSSHASQPIAAAARDEEEGTNGRAAAGENGVPHSAAAAPLPPNSHVSSSHHKREHRELHDERHESEAEKPHPTHPDPNVVGAGVPSRASVGHSSRLPARTAQRTTHGAEAASSSWRSEALRAETMAEQEARRRDVLAAYLGITPLREADVAALAPVPEFVDAAEGEEEAVTKADVKKKPASVHKEASVHEEEEEEEPNKKAAESAEAESSAMAEQLPPSQAPSARSNGHEVPHQPPSRHPRHHHHHRHRPRNDTSNEKDAAATETTTVTSHRSNKASLITTTTTTTATTTAAAAAGDNDVAQQVNLQDKQSTHNESQHQHSHHHHHHYYYHAATSPPPTPHVADSVPAKSTPAQAESGERSMKLAADAEADGHESNAQPPQATAATESVLSAHTRQDAAAEQDVHEVASSSINAVPVSSVHADTHPSRSTASVHEVKAVASSAKASLAPSSSHVQPSLHARSVRTPLAASRPASLAAAPQDIQSNMSASSRGRPQTPKWVERLSVPASRSQSASVAPSVPSSVHSVQHLGAAPASRPRSPVVRSATPQSALRGRSSRLASRSSSPGSAAAAAAASAALRRASSASCSARIAQLAQPRRRYDPVAEEKAVAEELALLQTEKVALAKSVAGAANTPRTSVAGAAALVSPSSSLRPSVVQRAAMNVRGRPIRVSAAATNASHASSVQPSLAGSSTRMQTQTEQTQEVIKEGNNNNNNNNKRSEAAAEAEGGRQNAKRDTAASNEANDQLMRRPSSRASSRSKASGALVVPAMSTGQATSPHSAVAIPMDERVRLMQLPHAAYFPTTALRLDLTREEDMKELYRQQYLVDPQLHPRPARRQFRTTPQADLFGMYSRHPEWYNKEGKENGAAETQGEEGAGRPRVGGRKQVPHRDGLQVLPSAAQKANDGMSILARFAEGGGGGGVGNELNNNNNGNTNNNEEEGKEEMSAMVGTPTRRQSVQQDGLYASNVSHFNLFSWDSFDPAEAKEGRNGNKAATRGIAGRASVPAALAAKDNLLNNMLPKENAVPDSTTSSCAAAAALARSARGNGLPGLYGGRALVRSRAAIQAQFAEQPENELPDRRPSARVTDAMQALSAFGDHDIFGVEERNAQLAQKAALAKQQEQEQKRLVSMNETTQTQDRSGSAVPYGGEDEEEGRPAEAPMFQPRVADGALTIHQ